MFNDCYHEMRAQEYGRLESALTCGVEAYYNDLNEQNQLLENNPVLAGATFGSALGIAYGATATTMTVGDILAPGGTAISMVGNKSYIRVMNGGMKAAEKMFSQLKGATDFTRATINKGYDEGIGYNLPNNEFFGIRNSSRSGPPSIDANFKSFPDIKKIKFLD